ncbi:MAG: FKBP-type peptidyl-prolyl cis-trans isomerase [Chlorobi bacterium]|nr:FKBP-type peptidyl-prolyl cis-trans isomerase [Chlorobiota bacterium]
MRMKNILILSIILVSLTLFSSCKSESEKELDTLHAYIESNNITTEPTASGLYYIETKAGTGTQAKAGNIVDVQYTGTFLDGKKFDSSYDRNEPFEFTLGRGDVIKGWDEGVAYMKKGGKATLIMPSSLAYGASGAGTIPPYTSLIFEVELVDVK